MLLDAFLFFNEFELLKVRLSYLGPHVDKFLIVESPYDFSGHQKSTYLNESFISKLPYPEKISTLSWRPGISQKILITLARSTRRSNLLWMIQHWQRNAVLKLAEGISDSAQVLFGDLDEFPSVESISRLNEVNPRLRRDIWISAETVLLQLVQPSIGSLAWDSHLLDEDSASVDTKVC